MFQIFSKYICNIWKILDLTTNNSILQQKFFFSNEPWPLKVTSSNFKIPVVHKLISLKRFKECNWFQFKVFGNDRVNFHFWNGSKASFLGGLESNSILSFPRTISLGKTGEENIDIYFETKKFIARSKHSNIQQNLVKSGQVVQTVGRSKVPPPEIKFQVPEEHWCQVLTKSDKAVATPFLGHIVLNHIKSS